MLNGVKVTFFDAQWEFFRPARVETVNIASLEAIAAMKVNVLFLRATYRDYYDLYFLSQVMGLPKIFELAHNVIPGLTYKLFCTALVYIDDITDDTIAHLSPAEQISKHAIRAYFEKQIADSIPACR